METLITSPDTPPAIEQLASKLLSDSGHASRVEITDEGYSHAKSQRKFVILVVGKLQRLTSLFHAPGIDVLKVESKRSGAEVRTVINVKTEATC